MLYLKQGVSLANLQPQMVLGLIAIHAIWEKFTCVSLVITSGSDGAHKSNSLHYVGRAVDLRTHDLHPQELPSLVSRIKNALGDQFDVVLEDDHIHVEFDPKKGITYVS